MSVHWHKLPDAQTASEAAAHHILNILEEVLSGQDVATIAISGGSTPKLLFPILAKARVEWSRVHIFWVDERCVPPTDGESNFKLAEDYLLRPAHIPQRNIHRILGEIQPDTAAVRYTGDIRDFFGSRRR